ncbi:MAG: DMT family transporter [Acidobacteria bacterium]|nr:DMT family transporter [Acidobacteriota bacterium]
MSRLDLLLVAMVAIWGANFSLVKVALRDFPELAFNAFRLAIASAIFLAAIWWRHARVGAVPAPAPRLTRADWARLALLGIVGHLVYQLLFLAGVKRTSVANGSLILGTTPVLVALLTAWAGHERVPRLRWVGAATSFLGLYIVVAQKVDWSASGHVGDALMMASTICWATYSVASVPILRTHSPLVVTGYSISIGALLYNLVAMPALVHVEWHAISALSWTLMAASAVFAMAFAYLIWYTSVQAAGSTRTAAWSNVTPVIAMLIAAVWLGEPIAANHVIGSAAIFTGLFITRRA